MAPLDQQKISAVFESRPDIVEGIKREADSPARVNLFNDIAAHVYDALNNAGEPAHKKRRVEQGASAANGGADVSQEEVLLNVKEISVAVPQKKKLELCLTQNYLYARAPGATEPIASIVYAWENIEYIFYLPIPEKTQPQHNYIVFPRASSLPAKDGNPPTEPLVFTVPATPPKPGTIAGSEAQSASAVSDSYNELFHWALQRRLKSVGNGISITEPDASKFRSVIRQPHRPKETAYHVGGFRGSKDGFLFFLGNGILWGFKKPLVFIPLDRIAAISYTNVLQITFNMVVEFFVSDAETDEIEFGMLDQQDFAGIDGYVKLNRLQDGSMAEQRKGKLQLAENKKKAGAGGENGAAEDEGGDGARDGETELERAQREAENALQDDEDEDEEDYDPGSEGESEGSGSSDEEEEGDDDNEDAEVGEEMDEEADEDGYEEEIEEDVEEEVKEEQQEAKRAPPKAKPAPQPKPRAAPARSGWAAVTSRPRQEADDMDEKLDVI